MLEERRLLHLWTGRNIHCRILFEVKRKGREPLKAVPAFHMPVAKQPKHVARVKKIMMPNSSFCAQVNAASIF